MNWQDVTFDWNQARAFLVTAEEGSLSAAARALGQTQPTLSRQVSGLEEALGVTLFQRVGKALELTEAGLDILEHFRSMGEAARAISLTASGRSQSVEGPVSIAATIMMAEHHLPGAVEALREVAPGIEVTILPSNELSDIRRREADIAIRHVRPEEPELIAKKLGDTEATMFATKSYLDRLGRPITLEKLAKADYVGFEHAERMLPLFHSHGIAVTRENFRVVSSNGAVIKAMMLRHLGISYVTRDLAALYPELEEVMPEIEPMVVPTWLVTHRELHTSRRIRLVFDHLASYLKGIHVS